MTSFEQPLVIYSSFCENSKAFIQQLSQYPNLRSQFGYLVIDVDPATGTRPSIFYDIQKTLGHNITKVPTIIIENGSYVLSGNEAFKWLDYAIELEKKSTNQNESNINNNNSSNDSFEGFNPNEMIGFSDPYSGFGQEDKKAASSQSFHFLGNDESINTPVEQNDTTRNVKSTTKQKDAESKLQKLLSERDNLVPTQHAPNPNKIDWTTGKINS